MGEASISKRPDDPETRQDREQSSFIFDAQRRAEAEPDLGKRVTILEDALRRCPGEPRLGRLWGSTREKLKLVNSIVELAQLYERGGNYSDALEQWLTLQIIHRDYPGLYSEIARIEGLCGQKGGLRTWGDDRYKASGETQTDDDDSLAGGFGDSRQSLDEPERNSEQPQEQLSPHATSREHDQSPAFSPFSMHTEPVVSPPLDELSKEGKPGKHEASGSKSSLWNQHPDWVLAGASTLAMITLAIILGIVHMRRHASARSVPTVTIAIHTSPPGASITINNEGRGTSPLNLVLPEGTYKLEARLDGYQPFSETAALKSTARGPIEIALQPLAAVLQLSTDLESGRVLLDAKQVGVLEQGQFQLSNVEGGQHTLRVLARQGDFEIAFQQIPGEMPLIQHMIAPKDFKAWALSSWKEEASVYSSFAPAKLALDNRPAGEVGPTGLKLTQVEGGRHVLFLEEGTSRRKRSIEIVSAPALVVFLTSERNAGALIVVTGEDDVRVSVNGKVSGSTQQGRLRIPNLPLNEYTVQVDKPGFETATSQVRLKEREDTQVEFRMRAIPVSAYLVIEGAIRDAKVFLDDAPPLGVVKPDGTFRSSEIEPGGHTIGLQLEGYKPARVWKNFEPGKTVHLEGKDLALERIVGTLSVYVAPRTDNIVLRCVGEGSSRMIKPGESVSLAPGACTVTATWDGGDSRSEDVQVVAEKNAFVRLDAHAVGMGDWENPTKWIREGTWFVHYGGGFVLLHKTPTVGRIDFAANARKGHRLQWVVGLTDESNYILYEMDEKSFQRVEVLNGRRSVETKTRQGMGKGRVCTVRVEIRRNSIVQQLYEGGSWIVLDRWSSPSRNVGDGKFGFFIPQDEIVALTNFSFQPQ